MSGNFDHTLLNPETPIVWLSSELASQLEVSRYIYIASISIWVWEFLISLEQECKMFYKEKLTVPLAVYVLTRISSFSFLVTSVIFQVSPVESCHMLQVALGCCLAVAISANSWLFVIRVQAIYRASRGVVKFFALLWLSVAGSSVLIPFATDGVHIGNTSRCINSRIRPYGSAAIILAALLDTSVFIAIAHRILMYYLDGDTWVSRIKSFWSGEGLTRMVKMLLQTSQLYYLATIGVNIITVIMILNPTAPAVVHAMFTVPNIALENSMACRVFRLMKFGATHEEAFNSLETSESIEFASFVQIARTTTRTANAADGHRSDSSHIASACEGSRVKYTGLRVEVEQSVTLDTPFNGNGSKYRNGMSLV